MAPPGKTTPSLSRVKQSNLDLQRSDGIQRHFEFDWQAVAQHNPQYQRYVEAERQRLGSDHPLFLSQYCLTPVSDDGRFLDNTRLALLKGVHCRLRAPINGCTYVAGVDLAGESERPGVTGIRATEPSRDSTVVTIGELRSNDDGSGFVLPSLRVVEHFWWTGRPHTEIFSNLVHILKDTWGCRRVVVDATGIGAGVAAFLRKRLGTSIVKPFTFTAKSKSQLGFDLLAAINSGRLHSYKPRRLPRVHRVLVPDVQGKERSQAQPDHQLLRRPLPGPRRLPLLPRPPRPRLPLHPETAPPAASAKAMNRLNVIPMPREESGAATGVLRFPLPFRHSRPRSGIHSQGVRHSVRPERNRRVSRAEWVGCPTPDNPSRMTNHPTPDSHVIPMPREESQASARPSAPALVSLIIQQGVERSAPSPSTKLETHTCALAQVWRLCLFLPLSLKGPKGEGDQGGEGSPPRRERYIEECTASPDTPIVSVGGVALSPSPQY